MTGQNTEIADVVGAVHMFLAARARENAIDRLVGQVDEHQQESKHEHLQIVLRGKAADTDPVEHEHLDEMVDGIVPCKLPVPGHEVGKNDTSDECRKVPVIAVVSYGNGFKQVPSQSKHDEHENPHGQLGLHGCVDGVISAHLGVDEHHITDRCVCRSPDPEEKQQGWENRA